MSRTPLVLGCLLFALVNVPRQGADRLRAAAAGIAAPCWKWAAPGKPTSPSSPPAISAEVIFREPASWSSSLWIALGEKDNERKGCILIAPNSPVLMGDALVGVVEYVGRDQSRVRLITDAGLTIAVRALRGGRQNGQAAIHARGLLEQASVRPELFVSVEEKASCLAMLETLLDRLHADGEEEWLAKGEICGASEPYWHSHAPTLRGKGFNYHYADEQGPARDLASGRLFGVKEGDAKVLLREGDLLVTSGLDGVFPMGIPVAFASKIAPLKEGACHYELEARPLALNLCDAKSLSVLPPLSEAR